MHGNSNKAPDWLPPGSAWQLAEGTRQYGSTGQLFEVKDRQWSRILFTEESCPGHVASQEDGPTVCGICGTHIDNLRPANEETP